MTQHPDSYPPPPGAPGFGYSRPAAFPDPLAPARRASVLLFVFGGLALVGGLCIGVFPWIVPIDKLVDQIRGSLSPEQLSQLPPGLTLEQLLRVYYVVVGILGVGFGVLQLCLAPFVRRGGRGSTVTAIVLFVLVGVGCLLVLLGTLVQFARGPSPAAIGSLFLVVVIGGAVTLALIFLTQAMRGSHRLLWHQQQMQARYWQYQQQVGSIPGNPAASYGYGYAAPPAPQQQAPVPPPPEAAPPPSNDSAPDARNL